MEKSLGEIVREAEKNYVSGETQLGQYVKWSMHETIETIDAYLNSKHVSGKLDSLGREKPFFNIVSAAANIWYRATDLDRKDIHIYPDRVANTALAFIANVILQNWMREARFGVFLNEWGRTLSRYGSAVVKFVEKSNQLVPSIVPWNRLIVDPVDFDALPRIEKFYKTAEQLRKMPEYDQDVVEKLINARQTRKTLDRDKKDNKADFIELYEVHGEMTRSIYKVSKGQKATAADDKVYFQQMHVVSFVQSKEAEWQDFTLFSGKEAKDPYMITHLIPEDGRTLGIGAVEYLFDAQWMANHTVKNIKDTLDIASRLIFQTADSRFVGRNVLSAIETGDIFIHDINKPLERIANDKPDITALISFNEMWQRMGEELTSTPEAMRGMTPKSGTAYRLQAMISQQAMSLFELMTENKGLAIEDMFRVHVLPFLKKRLNNKKEIVAILDDDAIAEIDAMYLPREAVRRYNARATKQLFDNVQTALNGGEISPIQPFDMASEQANVRESMASAGNKRFFAPDDIGEKTWKEALQDFEMKAIVDVTNEDVDREAVVTTLTNVFQTLAANPAALQDPNMKMLFGRILTETGKFSPLELSAGSALTPPPQAAPSMPAAPSVGSGMPALPVKQKA